MKLSELLDELRQNILHDVSGLIDGSPDELWSDETLIRYINEAYFRFCRRTLSLTDRTTAEVTQIALATGVDAYDLHLSILAVVSARLEGAPTDLARTGHGVLDAPFHVDDSLYFDVNLLTALPPGKPLAFATDESDSVFRPYPTPSADYNGQIVNLRVIRMPLTRFALTDLDAEPEIREEWQLGMLDWAAYKALSNHDADSEATERADRRKASFAELVDEATKEAKRRRFASTVWSFGQAGYGYTK